MTKPDINVLSDAEILSYKHKAASLATSSDDANAKLAFSIVRSLGKNLDDTQWIELWRGTVPDVLPLSPAQLEAVQGGAFQLTGFGYYLFTGDIAFKLDDGSTVVYSFD